MLQSSRLLFCAAGLVSLFLCLPKANGGVVTFKQKVPDAKFDEATARTVKIKRVALVRAKNAMLIYPHFAVRIETDRQGWELFGQLGSDDSKDHEIYTAWNKWRTTPKELGIVDSVALAKGKAAQQGMSGDGWTLAELIGCTGGVPYYAKEEGATQHNCMDFAWFVLQVAVGKVQCGFCASEPEKCRFSSQRNSIKNRMMSGAKLDPKGKQLDATVDDVLLTENAFDALELDVKALKKRLKAKK